MEMVILKLAEAGFIISEKGIVCVGILKNCVVKHHPGCCRSLPKHICRKDKTIKLESTQICNAYKFALY